MSRRDEPWGGPVGRRIVRALALSIVLLSCTWYVEDVEIEYIPEMDREVVLAVRRGFPLAFYYDPKFLPTVPALFPLGFILDLAFWFIISYFISTLAERW